MLAVFMIKNTNEGKVLKMCLVIVMLFLLAGYFKENYRTFALQSNYTSRRIHVAFGIESQI